MPPWNRKITCVGPDATNAIARVLARHLVPGDTVLLEGGVGAGKTHFARALIGALLAAPEDIPSPTYTLVQSYDGRSGEIWHADLYRLSEPSEIEELGLLSAFDDAICIVEWPDRLGPDRPDDALLVSIRSSGGEDETRELNFFWTAPKWHEKLSDIGND